MHAAASMLSISTLISQLFFPRRCSCLSLSLSLPQRRKADAPRLRVSAHPQSTGFKAFYWGGFPSRARAYIGRMIRHTLTVKRNKHT